MGALAGNKRDLLLIAAILFLPLYLSAYFSTTTFKLTGGHGGLSGPPTARVFSSHYHLLAFLPCYDIESFVRERTSHWAWPFGLEFRNGKYPYWVLAIYGRYSFTGWFLILIGAAATSAVASKLYRFAKRGQKVPE